MVDWFAPGFKAGGPIRSAVNLADQMEDELDIHVLTSDRDLREEAPYPGILRDQWISRGRHRLYYASPAVLTWSSIVRIIRDLKPDTIYLNSMFSRYFTLYPLLMKRLGLVDSQVVLAPRGMLMTANLAQKPLKKKVYINLFRGLGLPSRIVFHATDDTEVKDIRKVMGDHVTVVQAGNLPGRQTTFRPCTEKQPGDLKMVYVGRMHPLKNLSYLLQVLEKASPGNLELTVIASMEDRDYWNKCQEIITRLPQGTRVRLIEDLPHEKIEVVVQENHVFTYATKGENFSHSIFGALSAGRPVLISDRTPWRDLAAAHAGWDISLDDQEIFVTRINELLGMDLETLNVWCRGAWQFAHDYVEHAGLRKAYVNMFDRQLSVQQQHCG